jgi:dihydroorotate dehydrogenase
MFTLRHPALRAGRPFRLTFQTRLASTSSQSPQNTLKKGLYTAVVAVSTGLFLVYYFDSRSAIHRHIITPTIRNALDPETSHRLAVRALASGFGPRDTQVDDVRLKFEVIRDLTLLRKHALTLSG